MAGLLDPEDEAYLAALQRNQRLGVRGPVMPRGGGGAYGNPMTPGDLGRDVISGVNVVAQGLDPVRLGRGIESAVQGVRYPEGAVAYGPYGIDGAPAFRMRDGSVVAATEADRRHGGLFDLADLLPMAGVQGGPASTLGAGAGRVRSTQLPDISTMPTADAVRIARRQPHLIEAGEQSQGYYVGGPRNVQSPEDLRRIRREFDAYVAQDPRGADWYDRYRGGVASVTGNQPRDNLWMSSQHGQWSAGVSPESELAFVLRENNASVAGMPTVARFGAQHAAHEAAQAANDPRLYQLGEKTGEYARLINPDQPRPPGATGVNDFRHARNFRYTEASGDAQRDALTDAQHRFLDYETALAVDRANRRAVGGMTDWSGERLHAAPWVRQKALDILDQRPNMVQARVADAERMLSEGYGAGMARRPSAEQLARELAYEDAFQIANRTITDYFPKHTAFATHEAMVGPNTGHLPGSLNATPAERAAYSADPRSSWANAPGGRDAIYSGLRVGETGTAMRVLPTQDMQGLYQPPGGLLEANPGQVARPLVAFESGPAGRSLAPADRALLEAGEATRAFIDAQDAGAAHTVWTGGRAGDTNSVFVPMNRSATRDELLALREAGGRQGLGDVIDTGQGVTITNFMGEPRMTPAGARELTGSLRSVLPDAQDAYRVRVDGIYQDFVDKWQAGSGSGAATRQLLERLNVTPQMRNAFDNNPYIAENALSRLARDEEWVSRWGATREDIQNARRIIGEGRGWVGRLEDALKRGAVLPAIAGALYVAAANEGGDAER